VAVVFVEDTLNANCNAALFAKILNWLVCMARAEHKVALGDRERLRTLHRRKDLLVLDKLGKIICLDGCLAHGTRLVQLALQVSHTVLAESMTTIWQN